MRKVALLILLLPITISAQPKNHIGFLEVTDSQYKTGNGWYVGGRYLPEIGSQGVILWDNAKSCAIAVVVRPHLSEGEWKVFANKDFTKIFVEQSAEPAKGKSLPRTKTELLKLDSYSTCSPHEDP